MKAPYLCGVSNTYFQFKQFTVHQQQTAMKVCTDACLFGAWVADNIRKRRLSADTKALDIGTGTGLLSLILAQQYAGKIDAVELDADAALQATQNAEASPWHQQIHVHHTPVADWNETSYDLIISNPPFFEQDLKSNNSQRNLALHDSGLTLDMLWKDIVRCIDADGQFAVLLPHHRLEDCLRYASLHHFHLQEQVLVQQTEKHAPFRVMLFFGKKQTQTLSSSILIKKEGNYSAEFIALLKDYYLNL